MIRYSYAVYRYDGVHCTQYRCSRGRGHSTANCITLVRVEFINWAYVRTIVTLKLILYISCTAFDTFVRPVGYNMDNTNEQLLFCYFLLEA